MVKYQFTFQVIIEEDDDPIIKTDTRWVDLKAKTLKAAKKEAEKWLNDNQGSINFACDSTVKIVNVVYEVSAEYLKDHRTFRF